MLSLRRALGLLAVLFVAATLQADNTRSTAVNISLNTSVNAAISPADDLDYWRFELPSRGQLEVYTTGNIDTIGIIEDSQGNEVASDDDSGIGFNFNISGTAQPGVYYLRVLSYHADETGPYTLHLRFTPEAGSGTGGDTGSGGSGGSGGDTGGGDTGSGGDTTVPDTGPAPASGGQSYQALGDLNGDGKDDVLLRHSDGRWYYYPMNGRQHLTSGRGAAYITSNTDWQFAGIGDLNGDGKDDVLLRRTTDGRWYYYPMNGRQTLTDQRGAADIVSDLNWQLAGIGDLNGDGKDDVLLRHNGDHRWLYYPMNGRQHISAERGTANLSTDPAWQFAGIGDLNGDGKDDVLLRHTDGRWHYYPMNGRQPLSSGRGAAYITSNTDWQFAGVGDLNGDGKDDVLLRRTTDGRWYYYPMNGRNTFTDQRGAADIVSDLNWQLAGIGDLNGDGKDDVLLRHSGDNRWLYYPMNGRQHISGERGTANLSTDASWSIIVTGGGGSTGGSGGTGGGGDTGGTGGDGTGGSGGTGGTGGSGGTGGTGGGAPVGNDDHSDARSGATLLSPGGSVTGRIDPGNDEDYFLVQVRGSGTLTVYTTGSLDTKGEVQGASGAALDDNDNAGEGSNFRIERTVGSCSYYIKVVSYGTATGNYTLHADFSSTSDDFTLSGSVRDEGGSAVSGATVKLTSVDCDYSVTTSSNGSFELAFPADLVPDDSALTVYKDGYVPAAVPLDLGNRNTLDVGNITLETLGPNVIVLELVPELHHLGDDNYTGTINSGFQKTSEGTVFQRNFSLSAAQAAASSATITLLAKGLQRNNRLEINGNLVGYLDNSPSDGSYGTLTYSVTMEVLQSGVNTLVIESTQNFSGDYDDFEFTNVVLRFNTGGDSGGSGGTGGSGGGGNPVGNDDHSDARSGATTLSPGGSVTGQIEPGSDVDYFTVQVSGSGTLTVYTTGSTDTLGELQDSAGSVLETDDDDGELTNFRIERSVSAGTYYVEVGSYSTRTGPYTLHAEFSGGNAPDLTVDAPKVSNSNPNTGASFTLRATVRNRGNGAAAATTLRYYRSTDSTITSGDISVGTDTVGALSASGSSSESISLTAPSNAGTWYYGACVEAVSGESNTGNNCTSGVRVTVEEDLNTTPIQDIPITISSSCPTEIEVCVKDHACEDGDEVRVTVNNNVIFSGEIFNRWQCHIVPVLEGRNTVEMYAINGTGFKGFCDHSDINTGEIRIAGRGGDIQTQQWRHRGGAGSQANMDVTIGPSTGSCSVPGSGGQTGNLHGAIAVGGLPNRCTSRASGIAWNYTSQSEAESNAIDQCRIADVLSVGGCSVELTWRNGCAAFAQGDRCGWGAASRETQAEAEQAAISLCRQEDSNCQVDLSACTSN